MSQLAPAVLAAGRPQSLEKVLASGGEGKIWSLQGNGQQLAKLYRAPTSEHEAKLQVMLAHPPRDPGLSTGYISLAWPQELLRDSQGVCQGFLMPALDRSRYVPLFRAYVPRKRLQLPPGITWESLLRIACNIASVVHALHECDYVLGDVLNESNILIDHLSALICLVDCDSLQVPRPGGGVFRCPVGKSEFTPPELQGGHFRRVDRKFCHDNFALAVLVFLLLMQGQHPFDGVPQGAMPDLPLEARIQAGYCAYTGTPNFAPPPDAPLFTVLTPRLRQLFKRCFVDGHSDPECRPTALEWYQALIDAESQLVVCTASDQHLYFRHVSQCPWCALMSQGFPDPFASGSPLPAPHASRSTNPSGRTSLPQFPRPSSRAIPMVLPGQYSGGSGNIRSQTTLPVGPLSPQFPRPSSRAIPMVLPGQYSGGSGNVHSQTTLPAGSFPSLTRSSGYSSVGQQVPAQQMSWSPYAYNPVPVPRRVPRSGLLVLLLVALPVCAIGGTLLLAIAEAVMKALLHVG